MTERIQQELRETDLLPAEHFVDAGYASARVLVSSQEDLGIEMVCPISVDTQWQAHTTSGIEATISQGVRAFDLRRSCYVGLPKRHLQHLA